MTSAPTLTDGVVTLRMSNDADARGFWEQTVDPLTQAWTSVPASFTLEDARTYVRHIVPGGWQTDREWAFVVETPGADGATQYAGTVALIDRGGGRAEVSFVTHAGVRGTGTTEQALRLLLAWGFEQQGVRTVLWLAARGNWASRRLAWRLGFAMEGGLRGWMEQRGDLRDVWQATLLRGEEMVPRAPWLEAASIHGAGLVLRALVEKDLPRIVETLNDPETQRWHQRPREQAPHTVKDQAHFVLVRHEQAAAGAALHWAMADPDTDDYLGQMTLFSVRHRRQASLSYWTHPDARGRGLTTQAARLVARHCFIDWEDGGLGMRRLWSAAEPENLASRRVLESVGFVQTGVDRASEPRADGTWADQVRYDLLATD